MYNGLKRFLIVLVGLLAGGCYFFIAENAEEVSQPAQTEAVYEPDCYVYGREGVEDTRILPREIDGTDYFFLPSGVDVSALRFHFGSPASLSQAGNSKGQPKEEITVDLNGQAVYDEKAGAYSLEFVMDQDGEAPKEYGLKVMISANIPSVYLNSVSPSTKGREWVESTKNHVNQASGSVCGLDESGNFAFRHIADTIRIRGNSTADAKKKAYQIKLHSKEDLLNINEPRKDWALLANAYDTSLQHNTVTYQLGKELGLVDSPDCQPVDVYYDGEYIGNYLLTETPEVSASGVPIEKTGSYFMQTDVFRYFENMHYFQLSNDLSIVVEEPEHCTAEQVSSLKQLWEEMFLAVENGGIHPETGKSIEDYIDVDSFVRHYLVHEFCKNPDGFASSAYTYILPGESKLHFCALWDFDLSYGVDLDLETLVHPEGFYPDNVVSDISTIPMVQQRIKDVYENEFKGLIDEILLGDIGERGDHLRSLDSYNQEILASQKMNYRIWEFNDQANTIRFGSYEESVEHFKDFVEKRRDWLSEEFGSWVGEGEVEQIELSVEQPVLHMPSYPKITFLDKWSGAKVEFVNYMEQDPFSDADTEYHCRLVLSPKLGCTLSRDLSVRSDIGTVEFVSPLENGMAEVILNVGKPVMVRE